MLIPCLNWIHLLHLMSASAFSSGVGSRELRLVGVGSGTSDGLTHHFGARAVPWIIAGAPQFSHTAETPLGMGVDPRTEKDRCLTSQEAFPHCGQIASGSERSRKRRIIGDSLALQVRMPAWHADAVGLTDPRDGFDFVVGPRITFEAMATTKRAHRATVVIPQPLVVDRGHAGPLVSCLVATQR